MPLVRVKLPAYTAGCDADPKKVACDYPPYNLNKIVRKKFVDDGSPASTLVKNFSWTNDDQNKVADLHHQQVRERAGPGEALRQGRRGVGQGQRGHLEEVAARELIRGSITH